MILIKPTGNKIYQSYQSKDKRRCFVCASTYKAGKCVPGSLTGSFSGMIGALARSKAFILHFKFGQIESFINAGITTPIRAVLSSKTAARSGATSHTPPVQPESKGITFDAKKPNFISIKAAFSNVAQSSLCPLLSASL